MRDDPHESAAHSNPPVDHLPKSRTDNPMSIYRPPVMNAPDYFIPHTPQNRWNEATPPPANSRYPITPMGPPIEYVSDPFVSPTRGAANRSQPPMEDLMPYVSAANPWGYSSTSSPRNHSHRHYSAAQRGSQIDHPSSSFVSQKQGIAQHSQPLPNHSMAVDYPIDINMYSQYSRSPPPRRSLMAVTPSRVNPPFSTPHQTPRTAHIYTETVDHAHPYQPPHRRGMASQAQIGFARDIQPHGSSPVPPAHAVVGSPAPLSRGPNILRPTQNPRLYARERNDHDAVCPSNYKVIRYSLTTNDRENQTIRILALAWDQLTGSANTIILQKRGVVVSMRK